MALNEGGDVSEAAHEQSQDNRPPSRGSGRLVIALYWLFSLAVTTLAVVDAYHRRDVPLWVRFTAIFIGLIYVIAAVALTHNGRRMRILGWCMIALGLIGPLVCGLAQNHLSQLALVRNAWNSFGSDYSYLPLAVALIGAIWMWLSNPRRIVELAEQVERPGLSLRSSKISGAKH